MQARQVWAAGSHEAAVERFYTRGVNTDTDVHGGYLNFGLWEDGIGDYIAAAENLVRRVGTLAGLRPGARLLDVACGTGAQDIYLQRAFGPLEIDAIDVTWRHVERARRRLCDVASVGTTRFLHGSATDLAFGDGAFTHVLGVEGPIHFRTRGRFLAGAFRVLAPGGGIGLADYALGRSPVTLTERVLLRVACALWRIPTENVWTAAEYGDRLVTAGFGSPRIESAGLRTFPGYHAEQMRPAFRREMDRLQGRLVSRLGLVVTIVADRVYRRGIVDYVLVSAQKP